MLLWISRMVMVCKCHRHEKRNDRSPNIEFVERCRSSL